MRNVENFEKENLTFLGVATHTLDHSSGHYAADASTLASWGVDLVKMDHCGDRNGTDTQLYGGPGVMRGG